MKLLVDAQLPVRLAELLGDMGHDVIHTSSLPLGNRTPDAVVSSFADGERRIVVTKDQDFVDGHLLARSPAKLLLVSTGNIQNDDLLALFAGTEQSIATAFEHADFVEINRDTITTH